MKLGLAEFAWPLNALPVLRTAGRFRLEDRDFGTEYLSRTHALHVHDYDGQMRLGDATIALRPGDVTISPANVPSSYALPAAGIHWCVHFLAPSPGTPGEGWDEGAPGSASSRRNRQNPHPALSRGTGRGTNARKSATVSPVATLPHHLALGSLGPHAGQKIMAITQLRTGGNDPVASAAASAAMLELLLWLSMQSRIHRRTGGATRGIGAAERVAAIMHERLAGDLCIADLADEVELTQNYLARIFRLRYGTTMPRFLLTSRMDHAKHLLRHTAIPIARVAERVGMPDPQHFNKQFRRLVGVSPSQFRGAR